MDSILFEVHYKFVFEKMLQWRVIHCRKGFGGEGVVPPLTRQSFSICVAWCDFLLLTDGNENM